MAMPPEDPEDELARRVELAKGVLRRLQLVLRRATEGLSVAAIAREADVTRNTVMQDLRLLRMMPQANGKPRKPFEALPWRRAIGARGDAPW